MLVKYEMQWTIRYFDHQATRWRSRKEEGCSTGHVMYAAKQISMWGGLARAAKRAFEVHI